MTSSAPSNHHTHGSTPEAAIGGVPAVGVAGAFADVAALALVAEDGAGVAGRPDFVGAADTGDCAEVAAGGVAALAPVGVGAAGRTVLVGAADAGDCAEVAAGGDVDVAGVGRPDLSGARVGLPEITGERD